MNCLNCNKEVKNTEGKRIKKYCSDSCRASYWQKTHRNDGLPSEFKRILKKIINENKGEFDLMNQDIMELGVCISKISESGIKRVNPISEEGLLITAKISPEKQKDNKIQASEVKVEKITIEIPNNTPKTLSESEIKMIQTQINDYKLELKNPPKNPTIGLRRWTQIREDNIKELENKLK